MKVRYVLRSDLEVLQDVERECVFSMAGSEGDEVDGRESRGDRRQPEVGWWLVDQMNWVMDSAKCSINYQRMEVHCQRIDVECANHDGNRWVDMGSCGSYGGWVIEVHPQKGGGEGFSASSEGGPSRRSLPSPRAKQPPMSKGRNGNRISALQMSSCLSLCMRPWTVLVGAWEGCVHSMRGAWERGTAQTEVHGLHGKHRKGSCSMMPDPAANLYLRVETCFKGYANIRSTSAGAGQDDSPFAQRQDPSPPTHRDLLH